MERCSVRGDGPGAPVLSLDPRVLVNGAALDCALRVCARLAFPAVDSDTYLDDPAAPLDPAVSDLEWEVLSLGSRQGFGSGAGDRPVFRPWPDLPKVPPKPVDSFLRAAALAAAEAGREPKDKPRLEREARKKAEKDELLREETRRRIQVLLLETPLFFLFSWTESTE